MAILIVQAFIDCELCASKEFANQVQSYQGKISNIINCNIVNVRDLNNFITITSQWSTMRPSVKKMEKRL